MQKFYTDVITVHLEKDVVKRAWEFAQRVTPTTNYEDSNQTRFKKIRDDHFISKLGEEAALKVLNSFAAVKGPDYAIYEAGRKSWDDDLYINNAGIAVKTQRRTNAKKYGLSWTFQNSDKRRDCILDKPLAWVVFVEYNDAKPYQCFVYPPYQIKELVFDAPKLERLKTSKQVVYANTLQIAADNKQL